MGGLSFILAFLLTVAGVVVWWAIDGRTSNLIPLALVVLYAVGNAGIGFVDDYYKLHRRRNEGLTSKQKMVLQITAAAAFVAMMAITGNLTTAIALPFCDIALELSWLAYPLYILVLVGFVNSTNITDGLDGLASSVCAVVTLFITIVACRALHSETAVLSCALLGGVLGFLIYNHHPAKMFMGDTGSLFLGAVIMGCGIMVGEFFLFVLAGFVFVLDMLSSLLQRVYFKLTHGKRIFKMAPVHHHFEKCGWSEVSIVGLFSFVSLIFCVLAWLGR
jgi:phospho-N-acetylmuramoyl-pentapeptide-transferase